MDLLTYLTHKDPIPDPEVRLGSESPLGCTFHRNITSQRPALIVARVIPYMGIPGSGKRWLFKKKKGITKVLHVVFKE